MERLSVHVAGRARPLVHHLRARDYAKSRPSLKTENDPPYGWANALQHSVRTGQMVVAGYVDVYFARFVRRAAWHALDEAERKPRLVDRRGRSSLADGSGAEVMTVSASADDVVQHDVAATSRNRDCRALIAPTKECERKSDAMVTEEPHIAVLRPVSIQQLRRTTEASGPVKLKGAGLIAALHDASLVRPGMARSAIVKLGTAGWTSYFDVADNPAGRAYVDFVRIRRQKHMPLLEREVLAMEAAVNFAEQGNHSSFALRPGSARGHRHLGVYQGPARARRDAAVRAARVR